MKFWINLSVVRKGFLIGFFLPIFFLIMSVSIESYCGPSTGEYGSSDKCILPRMFSNLPFALIALPLSFVISESGSIWGISKLYIIANIVGIAFYSGLGMFIGWMIQRKKGNTSPSNSPK